MPPPATTDQVHVGCVVNGLPNWSFSDAVNCWEAPAFRFADGGLIVLVVSVWLTVTLTLLVAVRPPGSAIVTWKV